MGGNGFIAAFVAGLTLGNTERELCARVYEFGEAEGQLLTLVVFLIVGAVLVPETLPLWDHRGWLYALSSLTVVPHGAGRPELGRIAAATGDAGVRRLVRPARPRLDPLRADRSR